MTFAPSTTVTDAAVDDSIEPTTDARPSSAICAATTNGPLVPSMPIATVNTLSEPLPPSRPTKPPSDMACVSHSESGSTVGATGFALQTTVPSASTMKRLEYVGLWRVIAASAGSHWARTTSFGGIEPIARSSVWVSPIRWSYCSATFAASARVSSALSLRASVRSLREMR